VRGAHGYIEGGVGGERKILAVAVVSDLKKGVYPCGACLQVNQ